MSQTRADCARDRLRRRRVLQRTGKREMRIDRYGELLLFTINNKICHYNIKHITILRALQSSPTTVVLGAARLIILL